MRPDLGPLMLLGVLSFCLLVGLLCGVAVFLFTNNRWAFAGGAGLGLALYAYLRSTTLKG